MPSPYSGRVPKRDYLNDPGAPVPNALVPAVGAFVQDDDGRVLLIRRGDNGLWALPGGGQDIGESVAGAVLREVREETGLDVKITGVVGIYSNPGHVIAYDDGEVRQEYSVVVRARVVGGTLGAGDDAADARWVAADDLAELDVHPAVRLRIEHGLADGPPHVG